MPLKFVWSNGEGVLRSVDTSPGLVMPYSRLQVRGNDESLITWAISATLDPKIASKKLGGSPVTAVPRPEGDELVFLTVEEFVDAIDEPAMVKHAVAQARQIFKMVSSLVGTPAIANEGIVEDIAVHAAWLRDVTLEGQRRFDELVPGGTS